MFRPKKPFSDLDFPEKNEFCKWVWIFRHGATKTKKCS